MGNALYVSSTVLSEHFEIENFKLSEVARRVGLEDESEAANYISSMIEREKIKGKIEEWNQERLLVFEEKYLIEEEKIRKEFEDKKEGFNRNSWPNYGFSRLRQYRVYANFSHFDYRIFNYQNYQIQNMRSNNDEQFNFHREKRVFSL